MTRTPMRAAPIAVISLALMLPASATPLTYPTPVVDGFSHPGPPEVTAATWILYDEATDSVLASFLPTQERAIASTTKIMTALVVIENGDLDSIVTISQKAADTGEREIGLVAGERLPLIALLKAAMIHSANDAAIAIAEHVGGSVDGFVVLMNERAQSLGLTATKFTNPHGLDDLDHYSSASDLLELARIAMTHPEFSEIVRSQLLVFPDAPDGTVRRGTTTNLLLGAYEGNSGIKTGFTNQAGLTFVSTAVRNGRRLYSVVLGSDGERAHFRETEALFDYGFDQLGIYGNLSMGTPYRSTMVRIEPTPLVAIANIEAYLHIAGQGLAASPPSSLEPAPEVVVPPPVVVIRSTDRGANPIRTALTHWWQLIMRG